MDTHAGRLSQEGFHQEVTSRFGLLPNFFRTASTAPGLIQELWSFAKSAYVDNPLPALLKERLFVHLSRFCEVRYCIVRHVGFLIGEGRPAGDPSAQAQTIAQATALLKRATPEDEQAIEAIYRRLSLRDASDGPPTPETPAEGDLFDALTVLFLTPARSERAREAVRHAVGDDAFEFLTAFLAFVRTAHYWTETHPDLAYEPDMQACMARYPELARLLLNVGEAEAVTPAAVRRQLAASQAALHEHDERQAFLLTLSDAMRAVDEHDFAAIGAAATQMLGRRLGVDRCRVARLSRDDGVMRPEPGYAAPGAARLVDEYAPADYPETMRLARKGPLVLRDVQSDAQLAARDKRILEANGVGALLAVFVDEIGHDHVWTLAATVRGPRHWSGSERTLMEAVAERVWAAQERARSQAALRESEAAERRHQERRAFLLQLSDALRPLETAADIERAAVDLLGAHLGSSRVYYAMVGADGDMASIGHVYADGVNEDVGMHSLSAYRTGLWAAWRAGRLTIVADSETDQTLSSADRGVYASVSARAAVAAPLVKRGRLAAVLAVDQSTPRVWTDQETSLIAEVAERTWIAIERALAEAALHESEARLRLVVEGARDYAIFTLDPEGCVVDWYAGAEAVFGFSAEDMRGQDAARLYTPEDRRGGEPAKALAQARDSGSAPDVRWHMRHDGGRVFIEGHVTSLRRPDGTLSGYLEIGHDVTERRRGEAKRREVERRFRTLAEGIPQLVWRSCDKGLWTWASPQWLEFTSQTQAQSHGWGWLDAVHPGDREAVAHAWEEARSHGRLDVEYRIRRAVDGAYVWHHTRSTPVRDEAGRIAEWLGTSTDVQVLKALQERQDVLVAELQHRTFNLMGLIHSTADATIRSSASLEEFKPKFRDRIAALARVQRLLSRLKDEDRVVFDDLIRGELEAVGALQNDDGRVLLEGPKGVALRSSTVQTFAMALHELTTNAVKYGALKQPPARLTVRWRVEDGAGELPWLHMDWQESGVSMPSAAEGPQGTGRGRTLIEQALPYQLRAKTSYALEADGVRCSIALPVSTRTAADAESISA